MHKKWKLGTDLPIESREEYWAICDLARLLNVKFKIPTAHILRKQIHYTYADRFESCERCDEALQDCRGHDDDPYDRSDAYDDEADYE